MPRAVILSILTGVFTALSFPPFNFTPLVWVALVPLFLIKPKNARAAWSWGLLSGSVGNFVIFSWLWKTFRAAEIAGPTTISIWILLSLMLGLYLGVFFWIYTAWENNPTRPWLGGCLWVALDFIKSHLLTGFPWA